MRPTNCLPAGLQMDVVDLHLLVGLHWDTNVYGYVRGRKAENKKRTEVLLHQLIMQAAVALHVGAER